MLGNDTIIVVVSALLAALSFMAFALPMLRRGEKKERYKSIIEKRRKALFASSREELDKKGQHKALSAKESVALFFKVQEMAGEFGEKVRDQLLSAGIRSATAPITYMVSMIVLPIVFCGISMLFISASEKEISSFMTMMILLGAIFSGFFMPRILVKNKAIKRQEELNLTFPDALDMMLICVQGGIGLEQAVDRVAEEVAEHAEVLAEELGILSAEMAMLNDRREALSDFGKRVGGFGKSFATALIQAEQYGTSVSQALRVMADELRDLRMAAAEQKAMSLPPKLTVPMILFFLPSLFIVILGPAGIEASRAGIGG
jgi:tight adherence protein C